VPRTVRTTVCVLAAQVYDWSGPTFEHVVTRGAAEGIDVGGLVATPHHATQRSSCGTRCELQPLTAAHMSNHLRDVLM